MIKYSAYLKFDFIFGKKKTAHTSLEAAFQHYKEHNG